jgi:hypothetical protein
VTGGAPTLTLNDGGSAISNAAATASLGDPSKLVFDYTVAAGDTPTAALAVTGFNAHGATVDDSAGNHANLAQRARPVRPVYRRHSFRRAGVSSGFTRHVSGNRPERAVRLTVESPQSPAAELHSSFNFHFAAPELQQASPSTFPRLGLNELFSFTGLTEGSPQSPVVELHSIFDFHFAAPGLQQASPPTFAGLGVNELFSGMQEGSSHFPVAELHTSSDFHLV